MIKPLGVLEGQVVRGKQLGKSMGIPTANIPYKLQEITLPDGVYVGALVLLDQGGRMVPGVLNQGYHPTVPDGDPAVEIHLFDFDEDIYGQQVRVYYLQFMRPEGRFASKDDMLLVMAEDLRFAREWHQARL